MTLDIATLHFLYQAFTTKNVVAAKLNWLIHDITAYFTYEMPDVEWRLKGDEIDWLQFHVVCATETWQLLHHNAHTVNKCPVGVSQAQPVVVCPAVCLSLDGFIWL